MIQERKQQITAWLSSPRDYNEGVALYERHGLNKMYKRRFATGANTITRQMLTDELRRLAGLTEAELAALPRRAYGAGAATGTANEFFAEQSAKGGDAATIGATEFFAEQSAKGGDAATIGATETVRKIQRFRERWPFLYESDCPDVLKILVSDMISAYGRYKEAREALAATPDSDHEAAAVAAEQVIENFLTDREIQDELIHYRDHHKILGKCAYFKRRRAEVELDKLTDLQLRNKLTNARSNVSKWRGKLKAAEATGGDTGSARENLERWQLQLQAVEGVIEERKKKLPGN